MLEAAMEGSAEEPKTVAGRNALLIDRRHIGKTTNAS